MYHIVVRRGEFDRYEMLHTTFADRMPVIWDRRRRKRRAGPADDASAERRQRQRRGPLPLSWPALGFLVIDNEP